MEGLAEQRDALLCFWGYICFWFLSGRDAEKTGKNEWDELHVEIKDGVQYDNIFFANVPDEVSLLASGVAPAREADMVMPFSVTALVSAPASHSA